VTDMVDGNKIIIIFYFIYCVCANNKCCIMPSRGPDLENKVLINIYKCQICRKHQGMVPNGDLFQLVLGAE
jgi:hypothetical protein